MFLQTPSQDGCAAPRPIRRCSCLSAGHRWSHKHELHCADTYIYIVYLFVTTYAEWLWEINIRLKCTDSQMYKPLKWELFKLWSEAMQSPLVDLFHRYALPLGNILNCFTAFWDDANISCYCLCSNWMVSSYHDNLKLWEKKLHYVSKNYFLELKPSKKNKPFKCGHSNAPWCQQYGISSLHRVQWLLVGQSLRWGQQSTIQMWGNSCHPFQIDSHEETLSHLDKGDRNLGAQGRMVKNTKPKAPPKLIMYDQLLRAIKQSWLQWKCFERFAQTSNSVWREKQRTLATF